VPTYSWRILWLMNLPSGLLLVVLGAFIPESAKFLLSRGRDAEAHKVMAHFGTVSHRLAEGEEDPVEVVGLMPHHHADDEPEPKLWTVGLIGKTAALSLAAIAWGLINFGLLLWLPADLAAKGYSIAVASKLLAESALIAFPTVFVCAFLYSRWSTKWSLVSLIVVTFLGLVGVLMLERGMALSPVLPVGLLILGSNGILAILLPYTSESYPLNIRGRATGWVAACTKSGGVLAQSLSITALAPSMGAASMMIMVPMLITLGLFLRFGTETRGLDLRKLEVRPRKSAGKLPSGLGAGNSGEG